MFLQIGVGLDFAAKGLGDEQEHQRNAARAARDLPPIRRTSVSEKAEQRTGQPLRRHSHMAGRCEGPFWRRTSRQDARQIVLAARRYELTGRQAGQRNGPLGPVALEILDLMANLIHGKTGRLDPSIDWLMRTLKRSRDAITRGLAALRAHGFLDWLRRYVETGNKGKGPQVQQTSNAYRLSMPARALRLLGRYGRPAPAPEDHSHAQAARRAEQQRYADALPLDQRALFEAGDDELGRSLARLGRSIMERESARQTESGN